MIDRAAQLSGDIILSLTGSQEIARDNLGTLVNQLVKGVLTISTRFTPKNIRISLEYCCHKQKCQMKYV